MRLFSAFVLASLVALCWLASAQNEINLNPDCVSQTGENLWCLTNGECLVDAQNTTYGLICDTVSNCPEIGTIMGQDEGGSLNINLQCRQPIEDSYYECENGGDRISLTNLCDGHSNCDPDFGDDEINILCADKCRLPYRGGCPDFRVCISEENTRRCLNCFEGFYDAVGSDQPCSPIPAQVAPELESYSIPETSSEVVVCLSLSLNTSVQSVDVDEVIRDDLGERVVTVTVTTSSGSAIRGMDYAVTDLNATFTNATRVQCFNVSINGTGNVVTGDLLFNLILSNADPSSPESSAVFQNPNTEVTILDTDRINFESLVGENLTVSESDGVVQVCYEITPEIRPRAIGVIPVTIGLTPLRLGSSAFVDQSYNETLELGNTPAGTQLCINVSIFDDAIVEREELYLIQVFGRYVGNSSSTLQLRIIDDDDYTLQLRLANGSSSTIQEGGMASVEIELQGSLALGLTVEAELSIQFETASSLDITESQNRTITFIGDPSLSSQVATFSILIRSDRLLEGNETLSISLGGTRQTIQFTLEDATVGVVSFTQPIYTSTTDIGPDVAENTVDITAVLDVGTEFELIYRLAWIDRLSTYYDFVFSPSSMSAPVTQTISLAADGFVDAVLNVTLPLTLLPGNVTGLDVTQEVMVTITMYDPDVLSVTFEQSDYTFVESADPYYLYFSFNGSFPGPFSSFTVDDQLYRSFSVDLYSYTANVSSDVDGASQTFSFHNGGPQSGRLNYSFVILQDSLVEYEETFFIQIRSSDPFIYLSQSQLNISITSEDRLSIGFMRQSSTVLEDGGYAQVLIDVDPLLTAIPIVLLVTSQDLTATFGEDYRNSTSPYITIVPGVAAVYSANYSIVDDNALELEESFQILLQVSAGDTQFVSFPAMAMEISTMVTIRDDPSDREISIQVVNGDDPSGAVFSEGDGTGVLSITLGVQELAIELTLMVSAVDGSAIQDQDYSLQDFNVTFSPRALTQNVSFMITDDDDAEALESFSLTFEPVDPLVNVTSGSRADVYIQSSDAIIIQVVNGNDPSGAVFSESDGTGVLSITLDVQGLAAELTVMVSAVDGSATQGQDYSLQDFNVTFSPRALTKNVTFMIIDDGAVEALESFSLSFEPINSLIRLSSNSSTTVYIQSNDAISIQVANGNDPSGAVFSESDGTGVLSITLDVQELAIELTLMVSAVDGSATQGQDYSLQDFNVTFSPRALTQNVSFMITDDDAVEALESFSLSFEPYPSVDIASGSSREVYIQSNDAISIRVANGDDPSGAVFSEGDGTGVLSITLDVQELATELTLMVSVDDGSATQGQDYSLQDFNVTFSPRALTQNVSFMIIDDDLAEITESFHLSFATVYPSVDIANGSNIYVYIQSEDVLEMSFPGTEFIVYEGGVLSIPILLLGMYGSVDVFQDLISVAPGAGESDALFGSDYNLSVVGGVVAVSLVQLQAQFNVTAFQDRIIEDSEAFSLTLSVSNSSLVIPGDNTSATVYILNEDVPVNVSLSFGATQFTFSESDGTVYLPVTLGLFAASLDSDLSFGISISNGTAYEGVHFEVLDSEVVFSSSALNQSITIILYGDIGSEADRNFTFSLVPDDVYITVIEGGTVYVDIVNSDDPCISDPCDENAVCTRQGLYSFFCNCSTGYSGDGFNCTDIDECESDLDNCHDNAQCANTNGSFTCTCDVGFTGDGVTCADIDECLVMDVCGVYATCNNTIGGFQCACRDGFRLSNYSYGVPLNCTDIDECQLGDADCHEDAECTNTIGSFTCDCEEGYRGDGRNCTDIDECAMGSDGCSEFANCTNTEGSYVCVCDPGYTGDGLTCTDIDECALDFDNCDTNADCINTNGSFICTCRSGYTGDGIICTGVMFGDDPHFSVVLPSNKILCFSVMGEHHLSYNLISNEKLLMNAVFLPDSRRQEVTWIGELGIVIKNSTIGKSAQTTLKFTAKPPTISFNGKAVLQPRNIERIMFWKGRVTVSEAPPVVGFKYPSVLIVLEDAGLKFTVKFMREHLDMFWHSTAQQHKDSHGMIGQFFRQGVEIDEIRKILIMPNKEPVPVMRRPVWAFMEREREHKDDQLCWTAMNAGYQGAGLIDGKHSSYLVDNVLTDKFVFDDTL